MNVVEHQYERLRIRKMFEQCLHRAMTAEALVLERRLATGQLRRHRRQHVCERGMCVVIKSRQPLGLQPLHVLVDRIHEHGEGHVALELRCRTGENELCALLRAKANLLEQACFANSGLAYQLDGTWPPSIQVVEDALDAAELVHASDELVRTQGSSIEPPFRLGMPRNIRTHRCEVTSHQQSCDPGKGK